MKTGNSALKYLAQSAILIAVLFSCTKQSMMVGSGVLKGKISIGPICPVERIPPDPACLPTAETYKAWATAVWTVNKKTKIATLNPKLDGTYQIGLPAGDYIIDFDAPRTFGVGGSNLPTAISIANTDTTKFNINIDTGIR
ncbi:MAG: hypothetical protein NTY07_19970 [Bacteroidia bacterium]|nr:hypothetical protein [Bacteroidia bacterium]